MKKKLQLVSLLFLLLTSVLRAQSFTVGNFKYSVLSGTNVSIDSYVVQPTGSLIIPSTVNYSGTNYNVIRINSAFSGCRNITSVNIPNSVEDIMASAFGYCTGLTSLNIPNSVTFISLAAFANCTGLTSVNVNWLTPLQVNIDAFYSVNLNTIDLTVPSGTSSLYKSATVWKDFKSINETTLSTNSYFLHNNLQLHPNPAKEYVSISGLEDQENYSIFSILGIKMSAGSIAKDQKIDTQNLAPGTYFIKFEKGNSLKFIKE